MLLGLLYAAVSAYWGLGGTTLLDTIGGTLEREARSGSPGLLVVVWVTVALKLAAAALALAAVRHQRRSRTRRGRLARRAAWVAALILILYGGLLTLIGLLVQSDIVHPAAHADHRALRWHAYLWDPWFLLWGLLLAAALMLSRTRSTYDNSGLRLTSPVRRRRDCRKP